MTTTTTTTTATTTTPAPSPQLIVDVPCLRCRYNLRGLDPRGQCPECGHLVHVSVLAWDEDRRRMLPLLLESDPRWIRKWPRARPSRWWSSR